MNPGLGRDFFCLSFENIESTATRNSVTIRLIFIAYQGASYQKKQPPHITSSKDLTRANVLFSQVVPKAKLLCYF